MTSRLIDASVIGLFADLFEYPRAGVAQSAVRCESLIAAQDAEAAAHMATFTRYAAETTLGRQEETYTSMFDLNATCYPYAGYHLFGESYHRSLFLLN